MASRINNTRVGDPMKFLVSALETETDECVCWPYSTTQFGYGCIWQRGKLRGAHVVVCERIHGQKPSDRHEAAHSCGNGHLGCINKRHIRWATVSENQMDRVKHGTSNRGERCASAKLTVPDVLDIRRLAQSGLYTRREIAGIFNVSSPTVTEIHLRRTWRWLQDQGEAA